MSFQLRKSTFQAFFSLQPMLKSSLYEYLFFKANIESKWTPFGVLIYISDLTVCNSLAFLFSL